MKKKQIIPLVFATDDGYAPYLGIAIHSLIKHSSCENEYHIYIFYTRMSLEYRNRITSLSSKHIKITFLDISKNIHDLHNYRATCHFTVEATYRFFIAELLSQYPKVLYFDCDITFLSDVAELFLFDLGNHILGVAQFAIDEVWVERLKNILKVSPQDGFNSGVLLINTTEFIAQGIKEKCLTLLQEDWNRVHPIYDCPDQDALTIICQGQVAIFPMEWNFRWNMELPEKNMNYTLLPSIQPVYDKAKNQIKLLHYASFWKPWNSPELIYSDIFWSYARETNFYHDILRIETKPKDVKIIHPFPWNQVKPGSVIVLYGAGFVGQSYLKQVSQSSYCFVAGICDKNASYMKNAPFPLIIKENLVSTDFDFLLIAIEREDIALEIRMDLLELGIPEEKIKWK